jgi:hypothetical protein
MVPVLQKLEASISSQQDTSAKSPESEQHSNVTSH